MAGSLNFSDNSEWVFTGSSGTKGWAISGGKLTGFYTGQSNQIVYNPNVIIMGGRMYKMTVTCNVVPSDDSTVEIGTYNTTTSTFESFGGFFWRFFDDFGGISGVFFFWYIFFTFFC